MFCPECGSTQSDELKFCKSCGANLEAIREVAAARRQDEFDWSRTWVAEMFLSESERKRRKEIIERERGITPEMKRYTEIKAGVITSSIGVAVMIFLNVLMQGIIMSGHNPANAPILSSIWISGVIPFFVGLALIINGLFVSKKQIEAAKQREREAERALPNPGPASALQPADTTEFVSPRFGVTEGTTKHLTTPGQNR
jgi:hypothetical protein